MIGDLDWKEKARELIRFAVGAAAVTAVLGAIFFQSRFAIGLDEQPKPCLGHTFYILDKSYAEKVPEVGQCYAFELWVRPLKTKGQGYVERKTFAKRLAAAPGDEVEITKEGKLIINGIMQRPSMPLLEKIKADPSKYAYKRTLDKDEYFFLGDTVTSYDSRYWGVVHQHQIRGKVLFGFL